MENETVRFVECPECGNEQADMGRGVRCEECGFGPMPYARPPVLDAKADQALARARSSRSEEEDHG